MSRLAVLVIVALILNTGVLAKPKNRPGDAAGNINSPRSGLEQTARFSPAERNLIRAHLLAENRVATKTDPSSLTNGLRKKGMRGKPLPPGWQAKLEPGRTLDYQVYRQSQSLPDQLRRRLPPPPVGSETLRVEDKIMRLNMATRTILDVFDLVPAD